MARSAHARPPPDSADHAADYAHHWADRLDLDCVERMQALGIPEDRLVESDYDVDDRWMAFDPAAARAATPPRASWSIPAYRIPS